MNKAYNYIFHFSEYRQPEHAWACIHREDASYYWNGQGPLKGHPYKPLSSLRISYGVTPFDAANKLGLSFE